jgi:AraC-like DNA-binding protein
MKYSTIECEAIIYVAGRQDSAHHQKLGWSKTGWHIHNRGQLIYAENGVMRLYTGNEVCYIPSFHAAWIPEGIRHIVVTESTDLIFRTLYLNHRKLTDPFYKTLSVFHVSHLLKTMIEYTERWPLDREPGPEQEAFLRAIKLILPQEAADRVMIQLPATDHELLNQVLEHIRDHLSSLPGASALATRFGISERTMNRLFLKELKMPFSQYIKLFRITRALELLSQPGFNVTEVAEQVGYGSVGSFSNIFHEITGKRPVYFLKKH